MNSLLPIKSACYAALSTLVAALLAALSGCTLGASMQQQFTVMNTPCKNDMEVVVSDEVADLNGDERWFAQCDGQSYECLYSPDSGASCYQQ